MWISSKVLGCSVPPDSVLCIMPKNCMPLLLVKFKFLNGEEYKQLVSEAPACSALANDINLKKRSVLQDITSLAFLVVLVQPTSQGLSLLNSVCSPPD